MGRKRLTEIIPWILPLRKWQRTFCFYMGMALDGRKYAQQMEEKTLPYIQAKSSSPLYNRETGFDMKYQENKVFNLKLTAKKLDGMVIRPGETFSFWKAVRHADKETPYREGLTVVNGEMMTTSGGGLCQMSNLLFDLFLHSPLRITERRGHGKKEFPDPGTSLAGMDATVSEGWIDLKVENNKQQVYQIKIDFDEERIYGFLRAELEPDAEYEILNRNVAYVRKNGVIYQQADVYRKRIARMQKAEVSEEKLYSNCCEIAYQLPECVEIKEESVL
ncbi:MAG: glycopeptide resistance accessory protein VanW [Firmicutes bacterium]|nr:glycopeptide resistance accessory protein VanW [Bacillota bacterium]